MAITNETKNLKISEPKFTSLHDANFFEQDFALHIQLAVTQETLSFKRVVLEPEETGTIVFESFSFSKSSVKSAASIS